MIEDNIHTILPKESRECLMCLEQDKNPWKINLYLSHNRFLEKRIERNKIHYESYLTKQLMNSPMDVECERRHQNHEMKDLLVQLEKRNKELVQHLQGKDVFMFKPSNRLFVGMGGTSPYRNIQLLRLHFIYGIPYLPASALKGAMRHCWSVEKGEDEIFFQLFGEESKSEEEKESRGKLVFLDAFPTTFSLEFDVQTPHYPDYYNSQNKEPTDVQSPVILYFTCLSKAKIPVYIGCTNEELWNRCQDTIREVIRLVFTQYGLGGKTAIGYGLMDDETAKGEIQ